MAEYTLVIGNRNYSSWSLRGWLAAKIAGIAFDEIVIPLDEPATKAAIARHSPSGWVPVLEHRGAKIWDSLAIAEYLAEQRPGAGLWPVDTLARATARSVSAEMHSGFAALRNGMPMNIRARFPAKPVTPEMQADIDRIIRLWADCRARFAGVAGRDDGFLFGRLSVADAMFAPIVTRFASYRVPLDEASRRYCATVDSLPEMRHWSELAAKEPWALPSCDP
jgi:glutathione S-transferase